MTIIDAFSILVFNFPINKPTVTPTKIIIIDVIKAIFMFLYLALFSASLLFHWYL